MSQREWKPKKAYLSISAESARLVLRPYVVTDFAAWNQAFVNRLKKQHEFDDGRIPKTKIDRNAFRGMLRRHRDKASKRLHFVFGIFDRKTGAHLGAVDLYLFSHELRWCNLGYFIHNQHWGNGYAPEAAKLALKIAFDPLNLHRVEAGCETANRASIKTAQRAGLVYEGTRRKFFAENGGIDLTIFGMNAIDFKKIQRGTR